MIKGGYYIKARKIQDSEISRTAPHIREIWDWLLKEANHKDTNVCKRGQCVRSYRDIINGLCWYVGWRKMHYSKSDCENAMKWLKKHTMIATQKTTRGMIITIINYDKYQNPENYENTTKATMKATRKPQSCHTINKNDKNDKNDKKYILSSSKMTEIDFNTFWNTYPRKTGDRSKAMVKFLKLEHSLLPIILSAIESQKQSAQWQNKQFIPHPTTWLNQERWNDEVFKEPIKPMEQIARDYLKQYGDAGFDKFQTKYGLEETMKYDSSIWHMFK